MEDVVQEGIARRELRGVRSKTLVLYLLASHLAYYAAPLKPGQKAGRYDNDYDIVPGEDGPAPVAAAVEIISAEGQKVARLTVPGAKAANFRWGADGNHLAFAAGKVKGSPAGQAGTWDTVATEWQSLWVADLQGKMTKVADLSPDAARIFPLNVGPDGKQVHYMVSRQDKCSLWVVREGEKPVEVAPVVDFWDDLFSVPGCADGFFWEPKVLGPLFIGVFLTIFVGWIWFKTGYTTNDNDRELIAQSGSFRWKIPLQNIKESSSDP